MKSLGQLAVGHSALIPSIPSTVHHCDGACAALPMADGKFLAVVDRDAYGSRSREGDERCVVLDLST